MKYIKFGIYALLALWFADCAACGRVEWYWGLFSMLVFMKEMFSAIEEVKK